MYDFISTENILQTKKISSLVDSLLPDFIKEEGENFSIFLKEYYKWLEIHELVVENYVKDEYKIITEVGDYYISLENDDFGIDRLILESDRKNTDTFIINESIVGKQSGATAVVDRNMTTTDSVIYVKNITSIDFIPGEEIVGSINRTKATVNRFTKNPLFESRSLLDQIDIDGSTTSFLSDFLKKILLNIPENSSVDRKLLAKHIVDVYRSRGIESSYQYLFKSVYGVLDTDVIYPKEQIIKSSSGTWEQLDRIRLSSEDPIEYFEGRKITGTQSNSTAIVNRVFRFAAGSFIVTEISLRERSGNFVIGETVYTNEVDDTRGFGKIQGLVSEIEIVNPGTNYAVGDTLTITGGGGIEASAKVTEVSDGTLSDFYIFDGGDGYTLSDTVSVNNFGTRGSGFAGRIVDIDYNFTHSFVDSYIINYAHIFLNDSDYGFKKEEEIIIDKDSRLIDAFKFVRLNAGTISEIKTVVVGTGYLELPQMTSVNEQTSEIYGSTSLRILNFEKDPDLVASTSTITGNFIPSEKITTLDGKKIGTFYGTVKDIDDFDNPYRARYSPIKYFGAYGKGVNDLTINCVSYPSTDKPVVYDVQITSGGNFTDNKFKFRRNINSINFSTSSEYNPTEFTITGGDQLLEFDTVSITRDLTLATVKTSFNHGMETGQKVNITGASPEDYNGEHTIVGVTDKSFTYSVSDTLTTPATGSIKYNEGIYVKFGLQFDHDLTDRYLFSTIDFKNKDVIKGFSSSAKAVIAFTGSASSFGGSLGKNAILGIEPGVSETGSIKKIVITNPGVGFTSTPTATLDDVGSGDAQFKVKIGAISKDDGRYIKENGFLSDSKKIIDSDYYQDFSYSIKNEKQLNEYSELINKLLHPSGLKLFGEFTPEPKNLNLSFDDFILFEDGDSVLMENSNNNVFLTEKYTDPSYNTDAKILKTSQSTVTLKGGQNFLTGTNINTDYPSNSSLIIDNEQLFTVTYGDLLLETPLKGKIKGDSSNVINRFIISKPTSNFKKDDNIIQVHDDDSIATAIVLSQELDAQNNYMLITHSTEGLFDDQTIVSSGDDISQLILEDKSDLIYEDKSKIMLEDSIDVNDVTFKYSTVSSVSSNVVFGGLDTSKITIKSIVGIDSTATVETFEKHELNIGDIFSTSNILFSEETPNLSPVYNGSNWTVFDVLSDYKFAYKTIQPAVPATPYVVNATVNRKEGTDFQNDLKINDIITTYLSFDKFKVLDIINSSCLIANTSFNTGSSFNLITEDGYNLITQNNDILTTETFIELLSYFNERDVDHLLTEGVVSGTTSANGISDGSFEIISYDSQFHIDLSVGDVIRLSSNDNLNARIKSIVDRDRLITEDDDVMILNSGDPADRMLLETGDTQSLIVNKSLGNGKSDQKIILLTAKKIEFEEDSTKITLNNPYDGSNNFMYVVNKKDGIGQLLLEDGIPPSSLLYNGNVSTEGKLLFEEYTTFNNQEIRKIT